MEDMKETKDWEGEGGNKVNEKKETRKKRSTISVYIVSVTFYFASYIKRIK